MLPCNLVTDVVPLPEDLRLEDLIISAEVMGVLTGWDAYDDDDDAVGSLFDYLVTGQTIVGCECVCLQDGLQVPTKILEFPESTIDIVEARRIFSCCTEYNYGWRIDGDAVIDSVARLFNKLDGLCVYIVPMRVEGEERIKHFVFDVFRAESHEDRIRLRHNLDANTDAALGINTDGNRAIPLGALFPIKPSNPMFEKLLFAGANVIDGAGFTEQQILHTVTPMVEELTEESPRVVFALSMTQATIPREDVVVVSLVTALPAAAVEKKIGFGHDQLVPLTAVLCPVVLSRVELTYGTIIMSAFRSEEALRSSTKMRTLCEAYSAEMVPIIIPREVVDYTGDALFVIGAALKRCALLFAGKTVFTDIPKPEVHRDKAATIARKLFRAILDAALRGGEINTTVERRELDTGKATKLMAHLIPRLISGCTLGAARTKIEHELRDLEARVASLYCEHSRITALLAVLPSDNKFDLDDVTEQLLTMPQIAHMHDVRSYSSHLSSVIETKPIMLIGARGAYNIGPLGIAVSIRGLLSIRTELKEFYESDITGVRLRNHSSNMIDYGAKISRTVYELLTRARIKEAVTAVIKFVRACSEEELRSAYDCVPADTSMDGFEVLDLMYKSEVEDNGKEETEASSECRRMEECASNGDDVQVAW